MTTNEKAERFARELGKLLAERAGLDPDTTSEFWESEYDGRGTVTVKLTTVSTMTLTEYDRLVDQANARAS